jgi:hypothetical protein
VPKVKRLAIIMLHNNLSGVVSVAVQWGLKRAQEVGDAADDAVGETVSAADGVSVWLAEGANVGRVARCPFSAF